MRRILTKYIILLGVLRMGLSETSPACPLYTWQCNNGQCIKFEDLCDGNYDCDDKSDETFEECLLRPCPSYAFLCAYGACITGSFKCNGIVNCVDGSDENRYLCQQSANYEKEMQGNCSMQNSMECKSGECINSAKLCDGRVDCTDGSDETVEVCSFFKCPDYSFRCGYGACITGTSACDGIKDCRDGSDEIANICSNITSTTLRPITPASPAATSPTTITPTTSISTTTQAQPGSSTERPPIADKYCSSMPLLLGISSVASCFYREKPISCYEDLRAGTIANVTCAPGYKGKTTNPNIPVMQCDVNGKWTRSKTKCIPDCGTLLDEQKTAISKPWEVTILRRDYAPIFMPLCSGVIVSPKIVLTAATCFLSYNDAYYTDHMFYTIIPGFYDESYKDDINASVNAHSISSITIKTTHRNQDLAVLVLDNYFQFSAIVKPICLPTAQSNVFPFYNENKLNIGRPITRDTSRTYLEYLIARIENKSNGRKTLSYVNVYPYIPFVHLEMKKYEFLF